MNITDGNDATCHVVSRIRRNQGASERPCADRSNVEWLPISWFLLQAVAYYCLESLASIQDELAFGLPGAHRTAPADMTRKRTTACTDDSAQDHHAQPSDAKRFPLTTVGALLVGPHGRVLIVKTTKWRGSWGVPGGKVEWGETLEQALRREFREEVGLPLTQVRFGLLQEAVLDPQFCQEAHLVLVNYYAHCAIETITPNEEIVEWAWVSPQQALEYPLNSFTRVLIEHYLQTCLDTSVREEDSRSC